MPATKHLFFFLTPADARAVLRHFESLISVKYALCDTYPNRSFEKTRSLADLPELGFSRYGNHAREFAYLTVKRWQRIRLAQFLTRSGETTFALDQRDNPKSLVVKPAGIFRQDFIVRGAASVLFKDRIAESLYQRFREALRENSRHAHGYYIGGEALRLHATGARLVTMHAKQDREYDFVVS